MSTIPPDMKRPETLRPLETLTLAAWFGLLAGISEASVIAFRKFVLHHSLLYNLDMLWTGPVASTLLLLCLGILLLLLSRLLPKVITWRVVVAVFAMLAVIPALLAMDQLHRVAAALLAIGLGIQTVRIAAPRRERFQRLARRTIWALALLVALVGVGLRGWWALRERRALAALPAATGRSPNVLLLVLDTVAALRLSLYGYPQPNTPHLEEWARRGVRFDRAMSTAPWTLPSHASIMTGRWPHELNADWLDPLDGTYPTLAEVLGSRGYASAGFVANSYCSRAFGLHRGFQHYEDFPATPAQILFSSALGRLLVPSYRVRFHKVVRRADVINKELLHWLDGRPANRPFFAFLNYMDAHDPYEPEAPFDRQFSNPASMRLVRGLRHDRVIGWTPAEAQAAQGAYAGAVANLDSRLGALFVELDRRGLLANTIVIVTADHGEEFGEHGVFYHGNSLYQTVARVPLILNWNGHLPAGRTVDTPVSLRDLAATVMDLTGAESAQPFPGRSLGRFWKQERQAGPATDTLLMKVSYSPRLPRGTPVSRGTMNAVQLGGYRLIVNGDGVEELYQFHDSLEQHDLSRDPALADTLAALRASLNSATKSEVAPNGP
jgi:arylsulfatase A-like enzyme